MIAFVIIGAVLGLPLLLGLIWRVNTSYIFFSLLAGELLARYFGDDAELAIRTFIRDEKITAYADLFVLVLPVALTALFLRHTLSKGKLIIHVVPFVVTGFVFAAFALPLLPIHIQDQLNQTRIGHQLLESSEVIIGAVVFLQLITLWLTNKPSGKKKH